MRTIVFIGLQKAGSSREAVRAAKRLGYFTVVFTGRESHLLQRDAYADIDKMIFVNLTDKERIRKKIQRLTTQGKMIEAIVSFVDPYVHTAVVLCEEFCNKKMPTESILKMEDKILTREALKSTEFNMDYCIYNGGQPVSFFVGEHKLTYPLVVKHPRSTGSKDVLKADNASQLKKCINLLTYKYPLEPLLLEQYIEGPQYLVEVYVNHKEIVIVAILEQEITHTQRFIVTGYSLLAKVPNNLYNEIHDVVSKIIHIFQFERGSCHLELRRLHDQWKLIEINPRIAGGAMNKMIEVAFGINFVEQIIKGAVDESIELEKKTDRFVFTEYITVSAKGKLLKVTGKRRAGQHEGVYEVFVRPRKGAYLQPPLSMGHRYSYVLAAASTLDEARTIAKTAAKELKFHMV